jgi:hypothetical protein
MPSDRDPDIDAPDTETTDADATDADATDANASGASTDEGTDPESAPPDDAALEAALESLIEAARVHLAAVRSSSAQDDDTVWSAFVALNNASVHYDDLLSESYDEVTPWDVEYIDPEGEAVDEPDDAEPLASQPGARGQATGATGDDDVPAGSAAGAVTIAVRQRRDYQVPDVHALLRAGLDARRAAWTGVDDRQAAEPVTSVGEAVAEIVQAGGGGLDALDVPELVAGDGVLLVDQVDTALTLGEDQEADGEALDDVSLFVLTGGSQRLYRLDEVTEEDDAKP